MKLKSIVNDMVMEWAKAEDSVGNKYYRNPQLIRLDEKSLSRILSYHQDVGYIIVSAYRSSAAEGTTPEDQKLKNYKNDAELRRFLSKNLSFIPVYGGFKEKTPTGFKDVTEPSYIVTFRSKTSGIIEDLKNIGVGVARKYNQDSFFLKEPGKNGMGYFVGQDGKVQMTFDSIKVNDAAQEYFTKLYKDEKQKKSDKRFTFIPELYRMKSPSDVNEARSRYAEEFFSDDFFNN